MIYSIGYIINLIALLSFGFSLSIFVTCSRPLPADVQSSLDLSGDNRPELEAVLTHFKGDRQKFAAACFLISNMKYHASRQRIHIPKGYEDYLDTVDSLYQIVFRDMSTREILAAKPKGLDSLRKSLARDFLQLPVPTVSENEKTDLEVMSASFLIEHIDEAFDNWKKSPLLRKLGYDDFKEFVLPYRSTNEELVFTRQELRDRWAKILSVENNIYEPLERYKAYVSKSRWINHFTRPQIRASMYDLILPKFKMDCHNMTNWSIRILRSCGIPAVYEYTPQWIDRPSRHFWCVSPDSNGVWQPYTAPDNNLREDWKSDIQYASKVYRRQFAANRETPYFLANPEESIPEELYSPLLLDQTYRYHQTVKLYLPFVQETSNNLVYLCLFKGASLNAVGWGKIDRKSQMAVFEQVPLNTVFIPAYMDEDGELSAFSAPFMLKSEEPARRIPLPLTVNSQRTVYALELKGDRLYERGFWRDRKSELRYISFTPQKEEETGMLLHRKYPEKRKLKAIQESLVGAFFAGSDQEKSGYDTLAILERAPYPYLQEINLNNAKEYRYYRFWTPDRSPVNIAHMEFLDSSEIGSRFQAPTPLPIFNPNDTLRQDIHLKRIQGIPIPTGSNPDYAFDGILDTYVGASTIGMDFGKPVRVTHVRFVPRTADNGIVPGHEYSLWYYDGERWVMHSTQTATYNYLLFDHVPGGALYWLQNLTAGTEELPFAFEEKNQIFIHQYNPLYEP